MKKIGIDMRLYSQTGVGVYLRNLLKNLLPLVPEDVRIYAYLLPRDREVVAGHERLELRTASYGWHTASEQLQFLRLLQRDNLDLMHFTYFGYPVLYRKPFIATVHDITPLKFKTGKASTRNPLVYRFKHAVFRQILSNQVRNAAAVITPTHTVKKQLVQEFGHRIEGKIHPVYEGVNYELIDAHEDERLYKRFTKPFFLYVGNFYPHKNLDRLIEAYTRTVAGVPLLLVGPDDYFAKRLAASLTRFEKHPNVHFFHNPTLDQLVFFYKHALAFVHPTLSEGFGLPLIEAAYFHVPILASDIPVVSELLEKTYVAFDPYDPDDIASKMNDFIAHPVAPSYGDLLSRYSFSQMARETLALYLSHV